MSSVSPNFDDWRQLSTIKVWEIAALIHGFDPRAASDVVVRDPHDPTSPYGTHPDTSWEERALISAMLTHDLSSAPANINEPTGDTRVSVVSLVPWLRLHGYHDLAAELATTVFSQDSELPVTSAPPSAQPLSEPERRLKALYALGGTARWKNYRGSQQWRFTKISDLTAQENHANKKRSDMKTIHKDLTEAAEAESMVKKKAALLND